MYALRDNARGGAQLRILLCEKGCQRDALRCHSSHNRLREGEAFARCQRLAVARTHERRFEPFTPLFGEEDEAAVDGSHLEEDVAHQAIDLLERENRAESFAELVEE